MAITDFNEEDEYWSQTFEALELSETTISGKAFDGCTFKNCDFSDAILSHCKFVDCTFSKCNMSLVRIEYSKFLDVDFDECKMIGIDWTNADWPSLALSAPISFRKCLLSDCSFFGLSLAEIVFDECKAHGVDFREAQFPRAKFCYSDVSGSLFANTDLSAADFSEAQGYDIDIHNNRIKNAIFSRYEAVRLLESLEIELVD